MISPGLATLVVAAALLLPACSSDDNAASTSASAPTTSTTAASTTSTTAVPLLTPDGLGALVLRMPKAAARATGMLGPEGPGCEPSSTVHAPLLAPLAGHAAFNSEGRLLGLSLEGGTTTAEGVAPYATAEQVLQGYDGKNGFTAERQDALVETYGVFVINVSKDSGAGYTFVFQEGATIASSVATPGPEFCE